MNSFFKGLAKIFAAYLEFLKRLPGLLTMLLLFLRGLWRALRRCFHRPPRDGCCLNLPPSVHVRADPMIYDQYYLMSQGLGVTWDNPDINLFDMSGNPASGDNLNPDTDYKVVVRVWNNSYDAPAPNMPVYLSFLSFGIGITSTPVDVAPADLGVKGSAFCPAFANFIWHTPAIPGHYCLQALLLWSDDANPNNNLGQKNTQVGKMKSPATFSIPVHNQATVTRRFEIEADMYQLPALPSCGDQRQPSREKGRFAESQARWAQALRTQRYGLFPVTPDWKITITPAAFNLGPDASTEIAVSVEHAGGAFVDTQAFNIHGFASPATGPRTMAGGVTLFVQGS
jgi:hypothetical protein